MQRKKKSLFRVFNTIFISYVIITFVVSAINVLFNRPLYIDPKVSGIFNSFKKDANKYKVTPNYGNLSIVFSELPLDIAGRCNPFSNSIEINELTWQFRSPHIQKALIYHELAHCALLRDHAYEEYTMLNYSCPLSIMYPSIDPLYFCYQPLEDWYIKELFTNPYNKPLIGE